MIRIERIERTLTNEQRGRGLFSYLYATNLEVGLLIHFGREPKFHRVICENRLKHRRA